MIGRTPTEAKPAPSQAKSGDRCLGSPGHREYVVFLTPTFKYPRAVLEILTTAENTVEPLRGAAWCVHRAGLYGAWVRPAVARGLWGELPQLHDRSDGERATLCSQKAPGDRVALRCCRADVQGCVGVYPGDADPGGRHAREVAEH